jgi:uncharacterized membrane protein YkvA (DUF1232 family)
MNEQLDRIELKLVELDGRLEEVAAATNRMKLYAKWTAIITVGLIVIPLLLIPLFLPAFFAAMGVGSGAGGNTDVLQSLGL